ncbi:hypothetical protein VKT23_002037 [Stygiomarasmius scandens]|uniref:Uncharacterized protein n=1 Tax=Marasmiellus scandens TaxID=2682957 RepID=A0ABR1K683_9AGAR
MSRRVLLPLVYPVLASALPTTNHGLDYSGSACLAIVLTLVSVLSVLYVVKRVYMNHRRAHIIHRAPAPCPSIQSSQRSSKSFFYFSEKDKSFKLNHTAFWVGLLGSPRWETSIRASHESKPRYPFIHRIHPKTSYQKTSSSFGSRLSVTEFGARRRYSSSKSGTVTSRALSSTLQSSTRTVVPSVQLPAYPADARTAPSSEKARRRSLPAQRQSSEHIIERKKRHSSLNGVNRDRASNPHTRSSWIRRADPPSRLEAETSPLSPKDISFLDFPPGFTIGSKSKKYTPGAASSHPSSSISATHREFEGKGFISHPYALVPKNPTGDWEVLPTSVSNPLLCDHEPTPQSPIALPAPCLVAPASYAAQMPCSPKVAATLPRRRPKARTPSVRSRKSPPIGPSPLRIMTLPERSTTELCTLANNHARSSKSEFTLTQALAQESSSGPKRDMYSQLGIGYPSVWGIDKKEVSPDQIQVATESEIDTSNAGPSHTTTPTSPAISITNSPSCHQDQAADVMLDFIRELVEETSQWDSSLYMDDGFKALIQDSTSRINLSVQAPESPRSSPSVHPSPSPSSDNLGLRSPKSPKSPQSFTISVSRSSVDMDQVGVLDFDLEVYRMEGMPVLPTVSSSNIHIPMVSPSNSVFESESDLGDYHQVESASNFIHGQPLSILEEANEGEDGDDGDVDRNGNVHKDHDAEQGADIGLAV